MDDIEELTEEKARELFELKAAFIEEVNWRGMRIIIDCVRYFVKLNWTIPE